MHAGAGDNVHLDSSLAQQKSDGAFRSYNAQAKRGHGVILGHRPSVTCELDRA